MSVPDVHRGVDVATERKPARETRGRRVRWPLVLLALAALILALSALRLVTGAGDVVSSGTINAAIALAVPIAMAGLGGLWSERAGVVNIGLEGMMILGTFGAGWAGYQYGPWAGVLAAVAFGCVGGALHALATVTFGVDHIVSGVAINILGLGAAKFFASVAFTGVPGGGETQSPPIDDLPAFGIPGVGAPLADIESKGWFFVSDLAAFLLAVLANVNALTLIAVGLIVGTYVVLWRTAFGLRLRSCGESPVAAESLGVNVYFHKYVAVIVSGGLAGLGGAFLAIVAASAYRDGQTGGRGFIGLAAMIFGNWRPGGLSMGAGLFGYANALQLRQGETSVHAVLLLIAVLLLGFALWQVTRRNTRTAVTSAVAGVIVLASWLGTDSVNDDFTSMTPYVATLLVLAFASQRLRMPAADGQSYRRGEGG